LQRLYPYLSNKTQEAKFDTVNEYLLSGDAYLAPNWTFGVSEVVVKGGKTDIKVFSGWRGPEDEAHVLGGDVLAIPSRSDKRDKALQFAQYLLSKEVQSILADQLFWPSAREDAYEGIDPELRPYWDSINEALAKARARPTVPYWGEVEEILTQAWDDIVVQGMDVEQRLNYYAERLNKVRK
jgi:trehalose transport system substrate-binding protein